MKKLLFVGLMFVASSAWAGWVKIGENDSSILYMDSNTIRQDGNFRTVWELQDEKARAKNGVMSVRIWNEYDCKGGRVRILSFTTHSGSMTDGETLMRVTEPQPWGDLPPDTVGASKLRKVCAQ